GMDSPVSGRLAALVALSLAARLCRWSRIAGAAADQRQHELGTRFEISRLFLVSDDLFKIFSRCGCIPIAPRGQGQHLARAVPPGIADGREIADALLKIRHRRGLDEDEGSAKASKVAQESRGSR